MRAVDTNVLVRLVARDHGEQVRAAEEFVASGAWVSHLVLAEALWVLTSTYALDKGQVATAVRMLLEHDLLVVQEADVVKAALEVFQQQSGAGFVDCLIVEIARKAGHQPLGTFDRSMSKLPSAVNVSAGV